MCPNVIFYIIHLSVIIVSDLFSLATDDNQTKRTNVNMAAKLLLISLSISVIVQKVNSNIFFGDINPPTSGLVKCTTICDETYPLASNNVRRVLIL